MAKRPIFIPFDRKPFFKEIIIDFDWFPGFSITQARKSINSLHHAAEVKGFNKILEISTKSPEVLGEKLSAFHLSLVFGSDQKLSVECAFQGSKVFSKGGPYQDLYKKNSREAKKDERLKSSGNLIGFKYFNEVFPTEPKTAFYDWLYINALNQNQDLALEIINYQGFTDIAFNPEKSLNCQARSAAIFVSLKLNNYLDTVLESKEKFLNIVYENYFSVNSKDQSSQLKFDIL